jgi:hypothetical protein
MFCDNALLSPAELVYFSAAEKHSGKVKPAVEAAKPLIEWVQKQQNKDMAARAVRLAFLGVVDDDNDILKNAALIYSLFVKPSEAHPQKS